MDKDYKFQIGQKVKMQSFIDSELFVYGTIKESNNENIVILWDDKPKQPIPYFPDEYWQIKLHAVFKRYK